MAQLLRSRIAMRMVVVATVVAMSTGIAYAQAVPSQKHPYRGASTVSVATLKVPDSARKHFEKAQALAGKHEASEAARECEKALAIAPDYSAAREMLASQELLLKDFAGAISNVTIARRSESNMPWAGLIVAAAYNGLGRYDDALDEIQILPPAEAEAWQGKYEKARAEIGVGDVERALRTSAEALEDTPKDFSDTMLVRANALMLAHHWSEAEECLNDYLAFPGPQPHREQVRATLLNVARRMRTDPEPVSLASK